MATEKDTTTTRTAKDAGEETVKTTRAAAAEAADTGKKASREAADTAEKGAEVAQKTAEQGAETVKRGMEAGSDVAGKAAQTVSRVAEDTAGAARQMTEQSSQQFGRVFSMQAKASEEVTKRTQQNLEVMMQASSVLADGFQSVMREWVNYTQSAMQRNIDGVNSIMRARSVQDLLAAQSDLVNAEVELLLNSSIKISEVTARVANDAAQRINGQVKQQARKTA